MSKPPKINLGAILTQENQIKINHIENYNEKTCNLETKPLKIIPIILEDGTLNPEMNGSVLVSYSDFIRVQGWGKTECRNYNEKNKRPIE